MDLTEFPISREIVVDVPHAGQRYFHALLVGGGSIVVSTITALFMLVQVLGKGDPEWLRMLYFLVIALSLFFLIVGFKIVVESQQEQHLAKPHTHREWRMDPAHLTISLALLEGAERAALRRYKTGALRLEWEDIQKVQFTPQRLLLHIQNHEETLGFDVVVHVNRQLLAAQEPAIMAFFRKHNVTLEEQA